MAPLMAVNSQILVLCRRTPILKYYCTIETTCVIDRVCIEIE